jgi:hypothetical protein
MFAMSWDGSSSNGTVIEWVGILFIPPMCVQNVASASPLDRPHDPFLKRLEKNCTMSSWKE